VGVATDQQQAVLQGLLQLLAENAFLRAWALGKPQAAVSCAPFRDQTLDNLAQALTESGLAVWAVRLQDANPTAVVLAGIEARRRVAPGLALGAAAAFSPEAALRQAVFAALRNWVDARLRLDSGRQVESVDWPGWAAGSAWWASPSRRRRGLAWLAEQAPAFQPPDGPAPGGVAEQIASLVNWHASLGLEVWVADLLGPRLVATTGLHAVGIVTTPPGPDLPSHPDPHASSAPAAMALHVPRPAIHHPGLPL
jgi:hypothetical protein